MADAARMAAKSNLRIRSHLPCRTDGAGPGPQGPPIQSVDGDALRAPRLVDGRPLAAPTTTPPVAPPTPAAKPPNPATSQPAVTGATPSAITAGISPSATTAIRTTTRPAAV